VDFPDDIGQDMSEYEGDLTPSEGDWSDVFDPGDEIVDEDWRMVCCMRSIQRNSQNRRQ